MFYLILYYINFERFCYLICIEHCCQRIVFTFSVKNLFTLRSSFHHIAYRVDDKTTVTSYGDPRLQCWDLFDGHVVACPSHRHVARESLSLARELHLLPLLLCLVGGGHHDHSPAWNKTTHTVVTNLHATARISAYFWYNFYLPLYFLLESKLQVTQANYRPLIKYTYLGLFRQNMTCSFGLCEIKLNRWMKSNKAAFINTHPIHMEVKLKTCCTILEFKRIVAKHIM